MINDHYTSLIEYILYIMCITYDYVNIFGYGRILVTIWHLVNCFKKQKKLMLEWNKNLNVILTFYSIMIYLIKFGKENCLTY